MFVLNHGVNGRSLRMNDPFKVDVAPQANQVQGGIIVQGLVKTKPAGFILARFTRLVLGNDERISFDLPKYGREGSGIAPDGMAEENGVSLMIEGEPDGLEPVGAWQGSFAEKRTGF